MIIIGCIETSSGLVIDSTPLRRSGSAKWTPPRYPGGHPCTSPEPGPGVPQRTFVERWPVRRRGRRRRPPPRPEDPTSDRCSRPRRPSAGAELSPAGERSAGGEPAVKCRSPLRALFVGPKGQPHAVDCATGRLSSRVVVRAESPARLSIDRRPVGVARIRCLNLRFHVRCASYTAPRRRFLKGSTPKIMSTETTWPSAPQRVSAGRSASD
jgi:hypothetical protein